jgi:uncharacterized Zn finger protein
MPFAACPSCSQQNFTKAAATRTLKCSRCGQVYWVKATMPPKRAMAAAAEARHALTGRHGPAAAT